MKKENKDNEDRRTWRAAGAPCSLARSHTRHISRRLALSSAPTAAGFTPYARRQLCFPLLLKFTSVRTWSSDPCSTLNTKQHADALITPVTLGIGREGPRSASENPPVHTCAMRVASGGTAGTHLGVARGAAEVCKRRAVLERANGHTSGVRAHEVAWATRHRSASNEHGQNVTYVTRRARGGFRSSKACNFVSKCQSHCTNGEHLLYGTPGSLRPHGPLMEWTMGLPVARRYLSKSR